MRISDLQRKTIINSVDGKNLGNIIDIIVDDDGHITEIVSEKHKFFLSLFSSKKEIKIKWNQIDKIGEDVILVNIVY